MNKIMNKRTMNKTGIVTLALACAGLAFPALLAAQDSQESVADAARKAQAAKKHSAPAKMTLDNDTLDTLKGTVNVVGEASSAGNQAKGSDGVQTEAPKDESYWRKTFAGAYQKLADDSKELDITQRERNLNQQQYYTDPMAGLKQNYSRQDLNDQKAKIDDLSAKVAQDKADISQLEDQLRQAGGDPGWASQPAQPSGSTGNSQPAPSAAPPAQAPAPAEQPAPAAPAGSGK